MITRVFEWYRIVNPKPTSQTIDNRVASANDVIRAIDEAVDPHLALGCAAGVVAGFDHGFTQDSPVVETLVGAIRARESAFPQDLVENALELRVCGAIALGEILIRDGDEAPSEIALLLASMLRSGLSARPLPKGKYLRQMIDELDGAAAKVLAAGALSRRRRVGTLAELFGGLAEPQDLPSDWKSLLPALKAAVDEITLQSAIDREEIDVLWWMFAGTSATTSRSIAEMPAGAAALCCGTELGDRCLVPATPSLEAMVQRAYTSKRKPLELADRDISTLAGDWDSLLPQVLVPAEGDRDLAKRYPPLLPLSWLCGRLLASKGAAGWNTEFESICRVPSGHVRAPAMWAVQAFRERVALRQYAGSS